MDLIASLLAEEQALQAKLDAVRRMLAVYRPTHEGQSPAVAIPISAPVAASNPAAVKPSESSISARTDRFGSYGAVIIEKAVQILPPASAGPMMTRDLVERLEKAGVSVRGTNKVNALSALLARSSKLIAHGRRGWTLAEEKLGDSNAPKENEPPVGSLVGSDAADEGVRPPDSALGHSNSPARGS